MDTRKSKGSRARAGASAGEHAGNAASHDDHADHGGTPHDDNAADVAARAGAGAPIAERVGAVAVEIDRAEILAEAAAVAAADPSAPALAPASGPAPELDVAAKAADVAPAVRMLVAQCASTFAPGWEITSEESNGVADAAALVLAYWMPAGVVDPKYVAIMVLAGAAYGVAAARKREDGSWLPLRKPAAPATSPATPPAGPVAPLRIV